MSKDAELILGAVAYDPKVISIWDGFAAYFARQGLAFDYVLFTNYEKQVEAHFLGQIDVAWNSPLAWLQSERIATTLGRRAEAICMRDSDCDLTSAIIVRAGADIRELGDLRGKRVAVGAWDSPQATLIPLDLIASAGLQPKEDFEVIPFDVLVGKHGDHIGGERDAVRALMRGDADAACILDVNHLMFSHEGTLPTGATRILAVTRPYDHCNFTILQNAPIESITLFRDLLLGMSYSDPQVRPLLDMEGLKEWRAGRTSGYLALEAAINRFGTIDGFVKKVSNQCR